MTEEQNSNSSGRSFAVVAGVMLFATLTSGGGQPNSTPRVVPVPQVAAPDLKGQPGSERSVEAIRQPLLAMLDADPAADEVELQAKLEQARIRKLNFLIVTLPDPIDSSLGYAFDEAVNTLQTAVGT